MLSYNAALHWLMQGLKPSDVFLRLPGAEDMKASVSKATGVPIPQPDKALYPGAFFESTSKACLAASETNIDMLGCNLTYLVGKS